MKPATIIGIVLIVFGVLVLIYHGITYTTHKKVIDIGPVQTTVETRKTIPVSPEVGAIALAGGIVLLLVGGKRRR